MSCRVDPYDSDKSLALRQDHFSTSKRAVLGRYPAGRPAVIIHVCRRSLDMLEPAAVASALRNVPGSSITGAPFRITVPSAYRSFEETVPHRISCSSLVRTKYPLSIDLWTVNGHRLFALKDVTAGCKSLTLQMSLIHSLAHLPDSRT